MHILRVLMVTLIQVLFAVIVAFVGYHSLETFDLTFGNWFAIGFIGTMIVRAGCFLEKLDDDLTKSI